MNNRFWNSRNPHQGTFTRVLCVCSAGLLRSPTLAFVLANKGFNTRSVGAEPSFALTPVDDVLLNWADIIVCAEESHLRALEANFSDQLLGKKILVVGLPDIYQYRDPRLVDIIEKWFENTQEEFNVQK